MIGIRKMDNRGMMTVEAACIVPIILMIIVIEIFFGIFLIDMSSVKSETIRLADETADVWKTDGNLIDGTYKPQQLLSRNKNFLRIIIEVSLSERQKQGWQKEFQHV